MAKSKPSRVRVEGPLQQYAVGFQRHLQKVGYTPLSAANLERVLAHLSHWLEAERLQASALTAARLERFLRARRAAGYTQWISMRGLAPMLDYLRGIEVIPPPTAPVARTAVEQFFERYRAYLGEQRGLVAATIWNYVHLVRGFVTRCGGVGADFSGLKAEHVTEFVVRECPRRQVGSAKLLVTALRSLLRFLHLEGLTTSALSGAVPAVAGWRLSGLPRDVDPRVVRWLLESCDRRTAIGRRDYAVLLLLARLGLRAGEVARLEIDHIDWRHGELVVHGKGGRLDTLPLPADVGEALVAYLRRGRPSSSCRTLVLGSNAPHAPLSSTSIGAVVRRACARAGVPAFGAHRLRHTAATQMLQRGAGLADVGQVLRHRSLLSTAIYAKVNRSSLRALAQPWPLPQLVDRSSLGTLAQPWPGAEA